MADILIFDTIKNYYEVNNNNNNITNNDIKHSGTKNYIVLFQIII